MLLELVGYITFCSSLYMVSNPLPFIFLSLTLSVLPVEPTSSVLNSVINEKPDFSIVNDEILQVDIFKDFFFSIYLYFEPYLLFVLTNDVLRWFFFIGFSCAGY